MEKDFKLANPWKMELEMKADSAVLGTFLSLSLAIARVAQRGIEECTC